MVRSKRLGSSETDINDRSGYAIPLKGNIGILWTGKQVDLIKPDLRRAHKQKKVCISLCYNVLSEVHYKIYI